MMLTSGRICRRRRRRQMQVTSVGATRFQGDQIGAAEAAVSAEDHFGSGGGFSAQFKAPDWQAAAITAYYESVDSATLPDSDPNVTYAKGGRGTPDVAALGTGFPIIAAGEVKPGVGGTSVCTLVPSVYHPRCRSRNLYLLHAISLCSAFLRREVSLT